MKKITYSLALATALVATSCSSDESILDIFTPDSDKEMISFSMSDAQGAGTRAATPGKFDAATRIVMYMRSNEGGNTTNVRGNKTICQTTTCTNGGTDHSDITFETQNKRYWDDAFGRAGHISVYAVAIPGSTDVAVLKADDLKENSAQVDVDNNWRSVTDANPIDMTFAVTETTQTETTWTNEDLCYSNNIQKTGKDGRTWYDWDNSTWKPSAHIGGEGNHGDGRLQFMLKPVSPADPTGPGYFDKGHLKFYHALTRMTVKLEEDEGFNHSSETDFQFTKTKMTSDHNIQLLGMYTSGKLDMKTGKWTKDPATNIDVMIGDKSKANGTFKAQMLPDYEFAESATTTNVMQFEIDNNIYYVTQAELFKALADVTTNKVAEYGYDGTNNKFTMMQGKCYNFTIKVKKKQIDAITATVVAWDDVTAEEFGIDNSHVTFDIKTFDGTACGIDNIKFLRHKEELNQIYTDKSYTANAFSGNYWMDKGAATLTAMTGDDAGKFSTNWFYENNSTAYHFRSLNSTAYGTNGNNLVTDSDKDSDVDEEDKTYFKIASGADVDYHWGAPMITTATLAYDPTSGNGFKANIHQGITSNTSDIKLTELHMMSSIKVILKTKEDGSYINLKNATVTFTQITKNGTVDLGTGYITDDYNSSDATQQITSPSFSTWTDRVVAADGTITTVGTIQTDAYTWQFVPQPLVRKDTDPADGDYVGITIHTTDNNEYFIVKQLSEIKATSVTDNRNQAANAKIKRWFPGHQYTYTFTITKKGIESITCTLANWVDVTAADTKIDLESKPARRH